MQNKILFYCVFRILKKNILIKILKYIQFRVFKTIFKYVSIIYNKRCHFYLAELAGTY